MNLKIIIATFLLTLSTLSAEEGAPLQVKSTALYDTTWTNPSDGSYPSLVDWKLKVVIDDGYVFQTKQADFLAPIDPRTLVQTGDILQIIEEAYDLSDPSNSWFRILNVTTEKEFELTGLTHKPKPIIDPHTPVLQGFTKQQLSENKWSLSFYVNNLNTLLKTEMSKIYTTIEVASDKFHGFYEGMPLTFIQEQADEVDSFGKMRKNLVFFSSDLNEEVILKSKWMGGTNLFTVKRVVTDKHYRETPTRGIIVTSWTIYIYMEDDELFIHSETAHPHTNIRDAEVENKFRVGDTVELQEEPAIDDNNNQYQTNFILKNQRSGHWYPSRGSIRYLNGYP